MRHHQICPRAAYLIFALHKTKLLIIRLTVVVIFAIIFSMNHELPSSFDPQHPESQLQADAVNPAVDKFSFIVDARHRVAEARAAERNGQTLEGYEPVLLDDIDDER